MKYRVFGATGRTGKLIAKGLVKAGHDVTAIGRRNPETSGVAFVRADLGDLSAIADAVERADAVVSALASDKGNPVCSAVARALADFEGLRFVTIGGAGVDAPGDDKGTMDRFIGWIMRQTVGEMLADRQTELAILQESRLRWTMLRPPMLTDKPATGKYRISHDRPAGTRISRADLATAAIALSRDDRVVARAPFVAA